jgi:hypothetical protein
MNGRLLTAALVLGLGIVVACEREEPAAPAPSGAPAASPAQGVGDRVTAGEQAARDAAARATAPGGPAANAINAEASKLIDQATQYIKDNKYDLAEQALSQAEKMQSLSPENQQRIQQARQMLTAARKVAPGAAPAAAPATPAAPAAPATPAAPAPMSK